MDTMKSIFLFFLILGAAKTTRVNERVFFDILQRIDTLDILEGVDPSTTCGKDVEALKENITSEGGDWARKMIDASGKIPSGILVGNLVSIGHYDECLAIQSEAITFVGQHCMSKLAFIPSAISNADQIARFKGLPKTRDLNFRIVLTLGLCLPSSCSSSDIEKGFQNIINSSAISFTVAETACQTHEPIPLSIGGWGTVAFLSTVGLTALLSTVYDIIHRVMKKDKPHPLWSSFSIYSNGKILFQTTSGNGQMAVLHGIRTLSLAWVVLCHVYIGALTIPSQNTMDFLNNVMSTRSHLVISNGVLSVDSFFFLSGLLVCFVFFRDMSKKGSYNVPVSYLHRYLRLTPPFAVMMLIQATLFPYIGDGPLWHEHTEKNAQYCRDSWWSGLLYVQNYVTPESACLGQSWYLAADMQMYWLAPLLLYPMFFWPKLAPFFLVLAILGATFTTFGIAYANNLGPSYPFTKNPDQNALDYVPFHTRMAPWLIGIACGYLICGIKAKKIKVNLSPTQVIAGWVFSSLACLAAIFSIEPLTIPFTEVLNPATEQWYSTGAAASYLAFHRVAWGLGLAWIVFACVNGYGGLINSFLSWKLFEPFGKLSYCTYLIHIMVELYGLATTRIVSNAADFSIVVTFIGLWLLANLLAIPCTLLFEMPIGNLDKYFLRSPTIFSFPSPRKSDSTEKDIKEYIR